MLAPGNWQRILRAIQTAASQALAELAEDQPAHVAAADRAMARGDFHAAELCYRRACQLDPNDPRAAKGLAVALTAAGRHGEAAAAYRKALRLAPEDTTTMFNLAVALARTGETAEAHALLRRVTAREEDFVEAWHNLAALCTAQGKLAEARDAWRQVVARAPRAAYAHTKLGEVLMDMVAAFAEAAKIEPNNPVAHMNFAAASVRIGSFGQAVVATKRAAALAPGDPGVWSSLGSLLIELHRATEENRFLAEAVAAWEKSLAIQPDQPELKKVMEHYRKQLLETTEASSTQPTRGAIN